MGNLIQLRALLYCTLLLLTAVIAGCDSEDEIAAAVSGDEKLSKGAYVPFILQVPFPNPAEGITSVEFAVETRMRLTMRIHAEDWQEVQQTFDRTFDPGRYMYHLNVHDLAHGIYYCVLEGGGYTEIQKLRVVK